MDIPELIPIEQACELAGISRQTLYRLVDEGLLEKTPPTTTAPRRRVYITGRSLARYLKRRAAEHGVTR